MQMCCRNILSISALLAKVRRVRLAFPCVALLLLLLVSVDAMAAPETNPAGDTILIHNTVKIKIRSGASGNGAAPAAAPAIAAAPAPAPKVDSVEEYDRKPIFSLRTNLLVPLLNVGLQVPIGNRFSIGADWYYPFLYREWSEQLAQTNCFQALSPGIDFRVYLGKKHAKGRENWQYRLSGHSIGIYASCGRYDVEWQFKGEQAKFVNAGVDYMYSARIGKRRRLRMDFSVGVGYCRSKSVEYQVFRPGGKAYKTGMIRDVTWIGPSKASVSFVIPINKKVKKERVDE